MTNEEIILRGTIAHLGITPEEASVLIESGNFPVFHTYEHWKSIGYQVRKGERAQFKLSVWKQAKRKDEDGEKPSKMFLKTSAFFGVNQVDKIQ